MSYWKASVLKSAAGNNLLEIRLNMDEIGPGKIIDESAFLGYNITDRDGFAKSVFHELIAEEEDGTTLVHQMLETAIQRAIENGRDGFTDEEPWQD